MTPAQVSEMNPISTVAKAIIHVKHDWYGCETGCCGHSIKVEAPLEVPDTALPKTYFSEQPMREFTRFFFDHPYDESPEKFAESLVEQAIRNDHIVRELVAACGGYVIKSVAVSDD